MWWSKVRIYKNKSISNMLELEYMLRGSETRCYLKPLSIQPNNLFSVYININGESCVYDTDMKVNESLSKNTHILTFYEEILSLVDKCNLLNKNYYECREAEKKYEWQKKKSKVDCRST